MSSNKKITKTETIEILNKETGEILATEISSTTMQVDREPEYVKLYMQDIGRFKGLSGSSNDILLEFIKSMGYNNVIPVYMPIKKMVAKRLNLSIHTVNSAIKEFKKKELFISVARGIYIADPKLFAKGKWADIKSLRLVIEYGKDGTKTLSSNLREELQHKLGL